VTGFLWEFSGPGSIWKTSCESLPIKLGFKLQLKTEFALEFFCACFRTLMMGKLREHLAEISLCGLPAALEVIGERWSFMIVRAALNGVCHFEEYLTEIGIARNILANRLSRLTESGILHRTPCPEDRRKVEYRLTEKGLDFLPAMIALRQWGEKWETCVPSNPILADERDRLPILPVTIRSHDERVLSHKDLCWIDTAELSANRSGDPHEERSVVRKIGAL
jgi:DNA-binding HxlR family transcriptional regulator